MKRFIIKVFAYINYINEELEKIKNHGYGPKS